MEWGQQGKALIEETRRLKFMGMGIIMPDGKPRYLNTGTEIIVGIAGCPALCIGDTDQVIL